ncbi:MAG: hypothetical protein U9R58_11505 [Chloroflexota bacterium]|nr:hypothetical protein [Chloroflexota bacterium]
MRFIDPSGHICVDFGNNTYCSEDNSEPNDIWSPPSPNPPMSLTHWELKLFAMAVYAESANGSYPQTAMVLTGLWLLNRQTSGQWDQKNYPIWASLMGRQSALSVLYIGNDDFPLPKSYWELGTWASEQDLINWVEDSWNKGLAGSNAAGFEAALDATENAYAYLWGSVDPNIIYFSHNNEFCDHNTPKERWQWIRDTVALRTDRDPDFSFNSYGPFWSSVQGFEILLIGSNDAVCGYHGSCGPPWPPETP